MPASPDIQPVVLAGGRSRRFGRDKLREPWPDATGSAWLIDRPVAALREVFGPRVWIVGDCSPAVSERGDRHVPDSYPRRGPLGGILTSLELAPGAVFVLAGDLPDIDAATIRNVLDWAAAAADADAVLAGTGELEPCIGLYRPSARGPLADAMGRSELALHRVLAGCRVRRVAVSSAAVCNANIPGDLSRPGPPRAPKHPW